MSSKRSFFPVGNADMTLAELESRRKRLIDLNRRATAEAPDDDTPDAASLIRDRLECDAEEQRSVDVLPTSHPDKDHCTGLRQHFHLGPPDMWSEPTDMIFIQALMSQLEVLRCASPHHKLCDDARAFNTEVRRRVRKLRESGGRVEDGDGSLILGEDDDGRTDGIGGIVSPSHGLDARSIRGSEHHPAHDALRAGLAPFPADADPGSETQRELDELRRGPGVQPQRVDGRRRPAHFTAHRGDTSPPCRTPSPCRRPSPRRSMRSPRLPPSWPATGSALARCRRSARWR